MRRGSSRGPKAGWDRCLRPPEDAVGPARATRPAECEPHPAEPVIFAPVSSGLTRLSAIAIAVLVAGLGATGCGRSHQPDLVNGKNLFAEQCQRCHVLERAGGGANVGPNLDEAFGPAREDGLGEDTVQGVVRRQIANVRRGSTMPADLVTGENAQDVAAYVAEVAGQKGKDTGALAAAGTKVSTKPIVAKSGDLEMPAADAGLAFASTKAQAEPGKLAIEMPNPQSIQHNIALRDQGGQLIDEGDVVGKGGTSTITATVKPGEYEYVCTVPGHEEGGMKGTLTVK